MEPRFIIFSQFVLAFLSASVIYPFLRYLSIKRQLCNKPGERTSHSGNVPLLGGVGIFFIFCLITTGALVWFGNNEDISSFMMILMSSLILFLTGLNDDLVDLSPGHKVIAQLTGTVMILLTSDLLLPGFGGILGAENISEWISWPVTVFLFILGINAFNLIDGVDGLAAGVASLASIYFGIVFMLLGEIMWSFVSFGLLAALIGFLRFNLSENKKLFMGDSGSMFVGFLLVILSLKYILGLENTAAANTDKAIIMVMALFSYPLTDVIRVFAIRLKNGKSPFSGDKNHLHHFPLFFGWKHYQVMLIFMAYTIFMTVGSYIMFLFFSANTCFFSILVVNIIIGILPSILIRIYGRTISVFSLRDLHTT